MRKLVVLLAVALIVFGCAQKKVATEMGQEEPVKEVESEAMGEEVISEEVATEQMEAAPTEAGVHAFRETGNRAFGDIFFDFDSYRIREDAKVVLMKLSEWLVSNEGNKVLVEGHCDERGTNEYNLALGDRRATAVKSFLISGGVSPKKIETISYGEEKPLCMEAAEACWGQNRRAHFVTEGVQ